MKDKLKELSDNRSAIYGDPHQSHECIGQAWRAVLQKYFGGQANIPQWPAWVTALMMATFKNIRAANPGTHDDSFDDAHVYLEYAQDFKRRESLLPHDMPTQGLGLPPLAAAVASFSQFGIDPQPERRAVERDVTPARPVPAIKKNERNEAIRMAAIGVVSDDAAAEVNRVWADRPLDIPFANYLRIINEEVGEVSKASVEWYRHDYDSDATYRELVQVVASALMAAATIKIRGTL